MRESANATSCVIVALILSLATIQVAVAQEPITLAAALGVTGPPGVAASIPDIDSAFKDCIAIANEQGGINGKKMRYVMKDDQYKSEIALRVFEELMAKYRPLCVFGSGTPAALALAPLIRERYPVLFASTSFSASVAFRGVPSMFVPGPTYGDQFAVALKYIAAQKRRAKVAFFCTKGPFGEDPVAYGRIVARRLRLRLVTQVLGDMKGGDHSAQIEELKKHNPDFIILHGWIGSQNAALIKQCHELGLKSEFLVTLWGATQSVVQALGTDGPPFKGVSPYAYWWMKDVPMMKVIREYTAKNYPTVSHRSLNYTVAFTTGLIFVECLKRADRAGQLNEKGLDEALHSLRDFDTGGLAPPLTIKQNRFPVARILKSNPAKGILEPVSDWITFY